MSCIAFHPQQALLASGSWDNTVKVWNILDQSGNRDTLQHKGDVVTVAFRPDGKELAVSTLDGTIALWNVKDMRENGEGFLPREHFFTLVCTHTHTHTHTPAHSCMPPPSGTIDGRRDIQGGRLVGDKITAKHSSGGKCFTSLCYSADGACLLAGGQTKYVCIYNVEQKVLLKNFVMSENKSIDGILVKLNSKNMTAGGPLDDDGFPDSSSDVEERLDETMPGSKKLDYSSRRVRPEMRTKHVLFSPTGRAWAAATTEGLIIYSLDERYGCVCVSERECVRE